MSDIAANPEDRCAWFACGREWWYPTHFAVEGTEDFDNHEFRKPDQQPSSGAHSVVGGN